MSQRTKTRLRKLETARPEPDRTQETRQELKAWLSTLSLDDLAEMDDVLTRIVEEGESADNLATLDELFERLDKPIAQ